MLPVLFTAFEPSGDELAAAVIAQLLARRPGLRVFAWGGPRMAAAGAAVVERTGDEAVMGVPGIEKIREHRRMNGRIERWLDANPVALHVPVDSPAANFPICALTKRRGVRVVHLCAPQVWAWGRWRIGKLRQRTDLVLCLLPFEEGWFTTRGVPARFIGHPLFDAPLDTAALDARASEWRADHPRLALLPGSRPGEWEKNFPLLLECFRRLGAEFPGATGMVAATTARAGERLRAIAAQSGGWPDGLDMAAGCADAVIRWCDLALVVSGTVTLQIARHGKPMVALYVANPLLYHLVARWIVSTRYFALPNLIAGREVVPELIPHFGGAEPVAAAARRLLATPAQADRQRADLARIVERFSGKHAAGEAAGAILEQCGLETGDDSGRLSAGVPNAARSASAGTPSR